MISTKNQNGFTVWIIEQLSLGRHKNLGRRKRSFQAPFAPPIPSVIRFSKGDKYRLTGTGEMRINLDSKNAYFVKTVPLFQKENESVKDTIKRTMEQEPQWAYEIRDGWLK